MSWNYLGGKTWAEVTRDERFFCQHLYHLVHRSPDTKSFIPKLNEMASLTLNVNADWELGYEVCFYRDFWFLGGKKEHLHSPKRTFDLCFFSANEIVIVEAKAQQGFDSDPLQKLGFSRDKKLVAKLTRVREVTLLGLASSGYLTPAKKHSLLAPASGEEAPLFDGLITWEQLAAHFGNDATLRRADFIYEPPASGQGSNKNHMTLEQIRLRIEESAGSFYIGCKGGLRQFLDTHRLDPSRRYETSSTPVENSNWFTSDKVPR
ncbi:MAG: hypothetical protein V4614_18370 [Pseudomonadota bacterium]